MARIAGVDLPREKRVEIGLTYIYGIGRVSSNRILEAANVNPDTRVRDLTDEEVKRISAVIDETQTVEGDLRREIALNIKRLQERYDLYEGLVINVSLKDFKGICERDYPKIEAYLGLKKYLLRTFGVTLNIYSQKTKGGSDKTTDKP